MKESTTQTLLNIQAEQRRLLVSEQRTATLLQLMKRIRKELTKDSSEARTRTLNY